MKENHEERDDESCGTRHAECPNGNGSCERVAGHDGSHRCSSCRGSF